MEEIIRSRFNESKEINRLILENDDTINKIQKFAESIIESYQNGGKLFIAGNGGSAADSQHITAELVSRFYKERKALPAESLNVNTSNLTAIANDYDFSAVFSRQLEANAKEGDVFLGISTSGNSKNILNALKISKKLNIYTLGLTGKDGGEMANLCDNIIMIPSCNTPRIQEYHITIGHIICELIESSLFPN
ncbi:MAG: SIS domain-containing protein [Candidatus Acididesulfobacter diazotrophicus]|jgi:D-sedoheptulose 7-phosphate isomerase|uniref:Phosphoheptose isomerase n=1 Tax=Candidatus Acididesulfobacter diazotrophicus TaxID=2597226 RepID=A0A519BKK6_9DELT|nr:MAG: SIS domain-containing protein [Candidatus Acididesulfobacter diazotrophicus]